jgi:hypothetical protein
MPIEHVPRTERQYFELHAIAETGLRRARDLDVPAQFSDGFESTQGTMKARALPH